jgi:glycosyltransferase involved in cell wall biosynthesis
MQKEPSISVIVAIYNIAEYLPKCLDSVLAQTFTDFECILCDDASTDSSGEICDEYARRDKRFRVIHNKKNKGLPLNRKNGFEQSSGRYSHFIDGDDWIEPDMLEKMHAAITSDDYDMVYCDAYEYDIAEEAHYIQIYEIGSSLLENIKEWPLGPRHGCEMWNKLIKRNIVRSIRFSKYFVCEDRYFCVQLLQNIKKNMHIKEALYHYRFSQNSLCNSQNRKQCKKRNRDIKKNLKLIAQKRKAKRQNAMSENNTEVL